MPKLFARKFICTPSCELKMHLLNALVSFDWYPFNIDVGKMPNTPTLDCKKYEIFR